MRDGWLMSKTRGRLRGREREEGCERIKERGGIMRGERGGGGNFVRGRKTERCRPERRHHKVE